LCAVFSGLFPFISPGLLRTSLLLHLVVDVACHAVILHATPKTSTLRGAVVRIFAAILTFTIAKMSWRIFEEPLLKRGHAFSLLTISGESK
jgi:peptidoglycan/LPS O-acetylase OafA/YrhL